jgi:hypothetical protein
MIMSKRVSIKLYTDLNLSMPFPAHLNLHERQNNTTNQTLSLWSKPDKRRINTF